MILLGDIAFNGILSEKPAKNLERFKHITPILKKADIIFANLEVPLKVSESVNEYKEYIHFSLPASTSELLKLLNIGCVSLANNHIYDCGMSGLKATINLLDEMNIQHTGAGWLPEHIEPSIIETNYGKLAFLAYVDNSTNPKTEFFPELLINYLEPDAIISKTKEIKKNVDHLILSLHWGVDYSFYPTREQITVAHKLIDAGVDIIMGHHPHTLQPFERYNNGIIFYSLGGLTFGDFERNGKMHALYRKTKKGVIAKCDINTLDFHYVATKELIGNFIKLDTRDYKKWSAQKWRIFEAKESFLLLKYLIRFQENFIHRVYEYFFGYYQNPVKRLFQVKNISKIKKLFVF